MVLFKYIRTSKYQTKNNHWFSNDRKRIIIYHPISTQKIIENNKQISIYSLNKCHPECDEGYSDIIIFFDLAQNDNGIV